jgi:hypothetical protein
VVKLKAAVGAWGEPRLRPAGGAGRVRCCFVLVHSLCNIRYRACRVAHIEEVFVQIQSQRDCMVHGYSRRDRRRVRIQSVDAGYHDHCMACARGDPRTDYICDWNFDLPNAFSPLIYGSVCFSLCSITMYIPTGRAGALFAL